MGRYSNAYYSRGVNLDVDNKRRYYDSLIDPVIPRRADDIYVITTIGDRLDQLAWDYYADATLWFIIAAANADLRKDSLYLEPGTQLRIPADYQSVLALYQAQNTNR
jgi:phage tail protein X